LVKRVERERPKGSLKRNPNLKKTGIQPPRADPHLLIVSPVANTQGPLIKEKRRKGNDKQIATNLKKGEGEGEIF